MKKIFVIALTALFASLSCNKESVKKPPTNFQTLLASVIKVTGFAREPIGADLTGFPLLDLCSGETRSALSGTVVFEISSDGNVQPLGVYNLTFGDSKGIIHHVEYSFTIELFSGNSEGSKSYKMIFTPRGVRNDRVVLALMQTKVIVDGKYTVLIDSGTIMCR